MLVSMRTLHTDVRPARVAGEFFRGVQHLQTAAQHL